MSINVDNAVIQVQDHEHEKRDQIRIHVNDTGVEVQDEINKLDQTTKDLNDKRRDDKTKHEAKIQAAKVVQDKKDDETKKRLDGHDDQLSHHKGDLEDHTFTIDEHGKKLNTHSHQLGLVKGALDKDLKYGGKHFKGHDSADKPIDWDCK